MNRNYLDYFIPAPAILSHVDSRKPLCNGGGPDKPEDPPPTTAPYRADDANGTTQATAAAKNRKGLRKTILQQETVNLPQQTLGSQTGQNTTLGSANGQSPVKTVLSTLSK